MLTIVENPVLEKIGKSLNSELIQWAQAMENNGQTLNLDKHAHTITENGKFRLDKQGDFKAHGITWINLQVQHRDVTLFTVFVQSNGWATGNITEHSVLYAIKQGAHRGYKEQTVYTNNNTAVASARVAPAGLDPSSIRLSA